MLRNSSAFAVAGFIALLIGYSAEAPAVELVRDINPIPSNGTSASSQQLDLGSVALFSADDGIHGRELWATDGTAGGTRLVRDINPGPADSLLYSFTAINGVGYFWADDGTNGLELWHSDGTTAGTYVVANIGPGSAGFAGPVTIARPIATIANILYFSADDGVSGQELWRSDGTRAGTYRLMDIRPGAAGSEPEYFIAADSRLFFTADDGTSGKELWTTDGTVSGTRRVHDVGPGSFGGASSFGAVVAGGAIFFSGNDDVHGTELWRASLSGGGASMVADLNVQGDPSSPGKNYGSSRSLPISVGDGVIFIGTAVDTAGNAATHLYRASATGGLTIVTDLPYQSFEFLTTVGNRVVFSVGGSWGELWASDGTTAGTAPLRPGGESLYRSNTSLSVVNGDGEAFFYAYSGVAGSPENIWRTDGTSAGTRLYATIDPPFVATELVRLGGRLYFPAGRFTDGAGDELWTTDGTPAGTHRVADVRPGPEGSNIRGMNVALGRLFFTADDGVAGDEVWSSDGTEAGTISLGDINRAMRTGSSSPYDFTRLGDGAVFLADDGVSGTELWFTDGTAAGTRLVRDIAPGSSSSNAMLFVPVENFVLFAADDGTSGRELWRTDGTTVGTYLVADIAPGPPGAEPMVMGAGAVVMGGFAYFVADDGVHGPQMWKSDGTAAGTTMIADLRTPNESISLQALGVVAGKVAFRRSGTNSPSRLWTTDGTAAGTAVVSEDVELSAADKAVAFNDQLYFVGFGAPLHPGLWRTDGTAAGTVLVTDLAGAATGFTGLHAMDAALIFIGCRDGGCSLLSSDGTIAVTQTLLDASIDTSYVRAGSRLIFTAFDNAGRQRIYQTDGTPSGTVPFIDATFGVADIVAELTWFDGALYFSRDDAEHGWTIWRSDGTAPGTARFADIDPRVHDDIFAGHYFPLGSRLLFTAGDENTGAELYAIQAGQPNAAADAVRTAFNTAIRIDVLANDTPYSAAIDRASLEILRSPRFGNASVDASNGTINYTPTSGFSGADSFEYRVMDAQGHASNAAFVSIAVAAVSGDPPGSAPLPPNPGGGGTGSGGSSGGGGGGGSADPLSVSLLLLISSISRRQRARHRSARDLRARRSGTHRSSRNATEGRRDERLSFQSHLP